MMKHRLPFRDADVAYAPDFVDALQAQRWLQDLKELPDCRLHTLESVEQNMLMPVQGSNQRSRCMAARSSKVARS